MATSNVEWRYAERSVRYTYEVSNDGRVRNARGSLKHAFIHGYPVVSCGRGNLRYVHRLVAKAFIGPCPEGHQVNHKDGVKTNNLISNLEYVTPEENVAHALRTGLYRPCPHVRGSDHPKAKLSDRDVKIMRIMREFGVPLKHLGLMFEVSEGNAYYVTTRKTWRHL